jgi:hypothetical protein
MSFEAYATEEHVPVAAALRACYDSLGLNTLT